MIRNRRYRRVVGQRQRAFAPWRRLQGLLWLVGMIYFIYTGRFWPGILILILLSLLLQGGLWLFAARAEPEQPVQLEHTQSPAQFTPQQSPPVQAQPQAPPAASAPQHRLELLPDACPKCGAPIRAGEVKWTGVQSADCPYCGANLPMHRLA